MFAMGCCVGAEVCELVRLNILHYLSTAYLDRLAVFKNRRARIDDKTRKVFCEVLYDLGLKLQRIVTEKESITATVTDTMTVLLIMRVTGAVIETSMVIVKATLTMTLTLTVY